MSTLASGSISTREREFLRVACHLRETQTARPPVPVRQLLMSMPFYAICAAHFTFNWGYYSMLTLLPKYMSDVLHYSIKEMQEKVSPRVLATARRISATMGWAEKAEEASEMRG